MSGLNLGVDVDLSWLDVYIANPPAEAQQPINGATPVSRVERLRERVIAQERVKQIERYDGLRVPCVERVKDADDTLDLTETRIRQWIEAMDAGRLDPRRMMKRHGDETTAPNRVKAWTTGSHPQDFCAKCKSIVAGTLEKITGPRLDLPAPTAAKKALPKEATTKPAARPVAKASLPDRAPPRPR